MSVLWYLAWCSIIIVNPGNGDWIVSDEKTKRELGRAKGTINQVTIDLCILFNGIIINDDSPTGRVGGSVHRNLCSGRGPKALQVMFQLKQASLYVCPKNQPDPNYNVYCASDPKHQYCYSWSCVTGGLDGYYNSEKYLAVKYIGNKNCYGVYTCNPVQLTFLNPTDFRWLGQGLTYAVKIYKSGHDPGISINILYKPPRKPPVVIYRRGRRPVTAPTQKAPINFPLSRPRRHTPTTKVTEATCNGSIYHTDQPQIKLCKWRGEGGIPYWIEIRVPSLDPTSMQPSTRATKTGLRRSRRAQTEPKASAPPSMIAEIFQPLEVAAELLNSSLDSDLKIPCWLCMSPEPPFYEGYITVTDKLASDPSRCKMLLPQSLWKGTSLEGITGTCIYHFSHTAPEYCDLSHSYRITGAGDATPLIAPASHWWACTSGWFPCMISKKFVVDQDEVCVLTQVLPRIYWHSEEEGNRVLIPASHQINKRSPALPIMAGISVFSALGMSAASMGVSIHQYNMLSQQVDEEIKRVQNAIEALESSMDSLAEVALQNRRGLDLLLAEKGGLCLALGEQCCLYANKSGVVRQNLAELQRGIQERERLRQGALGWAEQMFSFPPWITNIIATVAGPIIVILVLATLGPCIVNRLTAYVKRQVQSIKLMMVRQQAYELVPSRP